MTTASTNTFYEAATRFLHALDEDWARHIEATGPCRHEPKPARDPYEALVRAIAYQQLHARAGDAILSRMLALYPDSNFPAPTEVIETDVGTLRSCGFSASKIAAIRGIAEAAISGLVPKRDKALELSDEELIKRLTSLRGVGKWTVEMFLIYTLERMDILPVDDLGIREGYRRLKGLDVALKPKDMAEIGRAWSPYRTVAAWYLWRIPTK